MINIDLHRAVMSEIIRDIYTNRNLGQLLGFKGGTAAMLFYGLDRFSVDLDFNLLQAEKEQFVYDSMHNIISQYGEIIEQENKFNTLFFLISYGKEQRKLKIEISKRQSNNKYDYLTYFGVDVQVMRKEFMFAHKLVAVSERRQAASRDLYDIDFFLKEVWDIEEAIIIERTGKGIVEYLEFLIGYIDKTFHSGNILQGLGEMLTQSQKDYARVKLKSNVLFRLKVLQDSLKRNRVT